MQRSEDRRSPGVKIPDSAYGLQRATSLFKRVGYSPGENLSMDPTYLPNQIASQRMQGTGLSEDPQMEPLMSDMGTSGLQSMSLSSTPEVVAGVGAIPPSMALAPPKKAVTKKNKNKKKKDKKDKKKKGKKKKGGYKKRRSTVRRSKKRRSTKRRSKKPTLKRRTQRKKNKV